MHRRDFITLLGGAAAAWPLAARAQQPKLPVIGFLSGQSPDLWASRLRAFRQGLNETGYLEGQNVLIEYRWAEGQNKLLPALAADLVNRRVGLIVAPGNAAGAAQSATSTIPVVFVTGIDPVRSGLVVSLNRPGGNLTGFSILNQEVGQKRLELLHELVPTATIVAMLVDPTLASAGVQTREMQAAAQALGLQLSILKAGSERDLEPAFSSLTQLRAGALVIGDFTSFTSRVEQLAALAVRYAMPTAFEYRDFAASGGLISYGSDFANAYRLAGTYTGRILKGEKPADLPVQQSTKIELIINLKTAKTLGLAVPQTLLVAADEVIE
jgi:putative ABC transport system substrate-binding protein